MLRRSSGIHAVVVSVSILSAGCATIGAVPTHTDVPTELRRENSRTTAGEAFADVTTAGARISLVAFAMCETKKQQVLQRTTVVEHVNETPGRDWTFGILGAGMLAGGAAVLVDSSTVGQNDHATLTYNPVGQANARLIGVGLVVLGAATLAIPTVDILKANATERQGETIVQPAGTDAAVHCKEFPYPSLALSARAGTTTFRIGKTDSAGRLQADLLALTPESLALKKEDAFAILASADAEVASVSAEPVYFVRELAAWKVASPPCALPTSAKSCDGVREFLAKYPDGPNSRAATDMLAAAQPKLKAFADEESWAQLKLPTCARPTFGAKSEDVSNACAPLSRYLTDFPSGAHRPAVEGALKRGRGIEAQIRKSEEAATRAASAAEEARLAREEAAESRRRAEYSRSGGGASPSGGDCNSRCIMAGLACAGRCADDDDACGNRCTIATQLCTGRCP